MISFLCLAFIEVLKWKKASHIASFFSPHTKRQERRRENIWARWNLLLFVVSIVMNVISLICIFFASTFVEQWLFLYLNHHTTRVSFGCGNKNDISYGKWLDYGKVKGYTHKTWKYFLAVNKDGMFVVKKKKEANEINVHWINHEM